MGRIRCDERTKPLSDLFQQLGRVHSIWQIFADFLLLASVSISNAYDCHHYEDREKLYMETIKKYTRDEADIFAKLFVALIVAMEECVNTGDLQDILGKLFHDLELHNKWKGQFFTPQNIADMMAMMSFSDHDPSIENQGFVTLSEPACGSGVMIVSSAKTLLKNGYNYQQQMVVDATDIDLKCVHMAYLQLSLYGIPAIVRHGDSIAMQEWSKWYTPQYIFGGWHRRNYLENDDGSTLAARKNNLKDHEERLRPTQIVALSKELMDAISMTESKEA